MHATSSNPCDHTRGAVAIPVVFAKGLSNQRMRMVQDVVAAMLIGAAVILPPSISSRRGCHFRADCYKDFGVNVPFWAAYDKHVTLAALADAGVCVLTAKDIGLQQTYMTQEWTTTTRPTSFAFKGERAKDATLVASELTVAALRYRLDSHDKAAACKVRLIDGTCKPLPPVKHSASMVAIGETPLQRRGFWSSYSWRGGPIWAWADSKHCCLHLAPDTPASVAMLARINAAFVPHKKFRNISSLVDALFRQASGTTRTTVLHWRGDEDFAKSMHQLDVDKYNMAVGRKLRSLFPIVSKEIVPSNVHSRPAHDKTSAHVLIVGDATVMQTSALEASLQSYVDGFRGNATHILRLHSKASLLSSAGANLTQLLGDAAAYDDVLALIDLQLAVTSNIFLGSPFSSFSVVAAAIRQAGVMLTGQKDHTRHTRMISYDTIDRLSLLLATVLPYSVKTLGTDVCSVLHGTYGWVNRTANCSNTNDLNDLLMSPAPTGTGRARTARCATLVPEFHFEPALDSPARLGFDCTLAVVTSIFGAYDRLPLHNKTLITELAEVERFIGRSTCWFAFIDQVTFDATITSSNKTPSADGPAATGSEGYGTLRLGLWHTVVVSPHTLRDTLLLGQGCGGERSNRTIQSRIPKMLMHCVLRHVPFAIYVDGKVHLQKPGQIWWTLLMARMQQQHNNGTAPAWVSPHHTKRKTVLEEWVCVTLLNLAKSTSNAQMEAYAREGFPAAAADAGGPGLIDGEWHFRDMRSTDSAAIGEAWFNEYIRWCHISERDQLSFNYVVWRLGLYSWQRASIAETRSTVGHGFLFGKDILASRLPKTSSSKPSLSSSDNKHHPSLSVSQIFQTGNMPASALRSSLFCSWALFGLARVNKSGIADMSMAKFNSARHSSHSHIKSHQVQLSKTFIAKHFNLSLRLLSFEKRNVNVSLELHRSLIGPLLSPLLMDNYDPTQAVY